MNKSTYFGAAVGALAWLSAATLAFAGPYGALATSPQADYGYSYNYDDMESAIERAMRECSKHSQDCQIKGRFTDTCVSIAKASNGAMGWAWGHGKDEDQRLAMQTCRENKGGDCSLGARFCTGSP